MINALYSLRKKYHHKKVYIWNINRDSLGVFMRVMFGGFDVYGFVTVEDKYIGQTYLGFPIISLQQIENMEDSLILVADDVPKSAVCMLPCEKRLYWAEAQGINEKLRQSKIIIYGIGDGKDRLHKILARESLEEELYCVTKIKEVKQCDGKKVIEVLELSKYVDYSVIISVNTEKYRTEILEELENFQGQVYLNLEYLICSTPGGVADPLQNIQHAISTNKKIYMYSKRNIMSNFLESFLSRCGINLSGYVDYVEDREHNIESIYKLAYDGIKDKFILLCEERLENMIRARQNIELAGFSLEKAEYTCFQWHTRAKERFLERLHEYHDPLVGGSILYPYNIPGWKRYGRDERDKIRILVLGGSTSSEEFYIENWVSKLYYKLKKENIKAVIYNGAHTSNDIVDEILRFLRDGNILRPQIVVSLSGINNQYYKSCDNQFNPERIVNWVKVLATDNQYYGGLYSDESLYDFWYRNEKILDLIVKFYGASFYCFLQPMSTTIDDMTLQEKSLYEQERRVKGAFEFKRSADDESNYVNLMHLFDHQDEMFFDMNHYTEKANEIIADRIYEEIIAELRTLSKVNG